MLFYTLIGKQNEKENCVEEAARFPGNSASLLGLGLSHAPLDQNGCE